MEHKEQNTNTKYNVVKLVKPRSAYFQVQKTTLHYGYSKEWCLKTIDEYYSKNKDGLTAYVIEEEKHEN